MRYPAGSEKLGYCDKGTDSLAGEKHNNQGILIDFAWKLKKRGLKERTITRRTKELNSLIKKDIDLFNRDSVETVLAIEQLNTATKANYVEAYRSLTKHFNISWEPIKVKYQPKQPFLPRLKRLTCLLLIAERELQHFYRLSRTVALG